MPKQTREVIGDVLVFDGGNADEITEACGPDANPRLENGALTLVVPQPIGSAIEVSLSTGDGLVVREMMAGFLYVPADQLKQFPLVPDEEPEPVKAAPAKVTRSRQA